MKQFEKNVLFSIGCGLDTHSRFVVFYAID